MRTRDISAPGGLQRVILENAWRCQRRSVFRRNEAVRARRYECCTIRWDEMTFEDGNDTSVLMHMPPLRGMIRFVLVLCCISFTAAHLNLGSGSFGGVTILWPSNGFLLGVLLCNPRRYWPAYILAGAAIDLSVNLSLHFPLYYCSYLSICNLLEVLLAAYFLYPIVAAKPDLTQRRQSLAFVVYGVILAPAIACLLASLFTTHGDFQRPTFQEYRRWFTADALGMATVLPLYLAFSRSERFSKRSRLEVGGLFLLLAGVSAGVFWQTSAPLLFVVLPVLLLLGVRLGLAGSAMGLMLVSLIGGSLSTAGHGPVTLMVTSSLSQRDLTFQTFIAISMIMLYVVEVQTAESNRLQSGLAGSERRFRLLAEVSSDIIGLMGLDGKRLYLSPAASEILGWRPEEILGGNFRDLVHPSDAPAVAQLFEDCVAGKAARPVEYRCRRADGRYIWMEMSVRLHQDADSGAPAGFVTVARSIMLRKTEEEAKQRAFEKVERMASSDALTGVANRREFDRVIEQEWLRATREKTTLSLLLIDLDRFKPYNDLCGHLAGDDCLRQVVATIQTVVNRPADLLARYGGEEFVVILPSTEAKGAVQIAEWIRRAVEKCGLPHPGNPPSGVITLSIGCAALVPRAEFTLADLVEAADGALYEAKSAGRNCVKLAEVFPSLGKAKATG